MTFQERKVLLLKNWNDIVKRKEKERRRKSLGQIHLYICNECDFYFKHDLDLKSVFCPRCNSIDVIERNLNTERKTFANK